jgi:phage-related protein
LFRHSENHKNQPLQARKTIKICLFHHRFLTCFEFASSIMKQVIFGALNFARSASASLSRSISGKFGKIESFLHLS